MYVSLLVIHGLRDHSAARFSSGSKADHGVDDDICKLKVETFPPASVEIKILVLFLNSSIASFRSSISMLPFKTVTEAAIYQQLLQIFLCGKRTPVKIMIFWVLSSLIMASMVSVMAPPLHPDFGIVPALQRR